MITVDEAKIIIKQAVSPLAPVQLTVAEAAGLVLAKDVFAIMDIPAFDQSSMDGYAFSFSGWQSHQTLQVKGEIPAGSKEIISFSPEHAVRIFTGAAVPEGTDTVVMQEKVSVTNGTLTIEDRQLSAGMNVRPKGSEIRKGALALPAGTFLSPAAVGFLTGIGITKVMVYPRPSISIIVTGKELQQPGMNLERGQVYESNSATLSAALRQMHLFDIKIYHADDDLDILKNILETALKETDVVLLTGGTSVGDYDFVLEAATKSGVSKLFHKIKQRPGKPLYFGKKGNELVFGLPGNPSSVLTCFYEYVIPALQQLSNQQTDALKTSQVPPAKSFEKNTGLTHFLKGWYDGSQVSYLDAQESYRLGSFAKANCLIKINEDVTHCDKGENVEVHLLPG